MTGDACHIFKLPLVLAIGLIALTIVPQNIAHAQGPDRKKSDAPSRSERPTVQRPMPSAKLSALAAFGTLRDPLTGDRVVAQAVYVKLRRSSIEADPRTTVISIATRAGIRPHEATMIIADIAPVIAEPNLSRLVELYYSEPIHPRQAAAILSREAEVEYADPMLLPELLSPFNDPMQSDQYQLAQVKAIGAWAIWPGDTTMTIGVVDAGIDLTHEDLAPNIQENIGEAGLDGEANDRRTNGIDDDSNGVVDDWRGANLTWREDGSTAGDTRGSAHGTQVSGLAAARSNNGIGITGVGGLCKFFPVKAAATNSGLLTRAYEGILYCARRGFKVINCSWGTSGYSPAQQDFITDIVESYDCAIVAGGGNSPVYTLFFPAGYNGVMGVGAVDRNDRYTTAWGEQIDISSPGGLSTSDGNQYVDVSSATSYAAPVVSGGLALIRSRWPSLNAAAAIAHLRLTADSITAASSDKYMLDGFGRMNLERALSTDPMSHPALVVDSLWLQTPQGTPMQRATVGDTGGIRLRVRNLLGTATNARVRVYSYTAERDLITVDSLWIDLGRFDAGEERVVSSAVGFKVRSLANDRVRLRVEFLADGYNDYQYERVLFYQPYITAGTRDLQATLSDNGRLAYDDIDNTIGEGFSYLGNSMLYEGGFVIAHDSMRVLSNTRNAIPGMQQEDFRPLEYPSASNGYTLTMDDSRAGSRALGLVLKVRLITDSTIPNAIAVELRTSSTSPLSLDSLHVAMFADWDLDNNAYGQGVRLVERQLGSVLLHGIIEGERTPLKIAHGLLAPATLPLFYAIRNDSLPFDIYNGFADGEKWQAIASGIGNRDVPADDSTDVSLMIGHTVSHLAMHDEDTTVWVIGLGETTDKAVEGMLALAGRLHPTSGITHDGATLGGSLLAVPYPNPATSTVSIPIGPVHNSHLELVDSRGVRIINLDRHLSANGLPSFLVLDVSALPSGSYMLRLTTPSGTETRAVVVRH